MKKIISFMLTTILLLTANICVFAEDSDSKIDFSLQCNGKNTITVKAGTEIQVDLVLKNKEPYEVLTLTDEIEFNETFFDYIGEITPMTPKVDGEKQSYTGGIDVIKVIGSYTTPQTYEANQHIISLKLKVKDNATGYGMVISDPATAMVCGTNEYASKNTDLTVIIGDETVEQRVLSFETNGGNSIPAVIKEKGETISLTSYSPSREGYTFDGWYTDNDTFENKVTRIVLNDNTTVYAKWTWIPTGGGSGGGGGNISLADYTLTFETNGGTEIESVSKTKNTTVDLSKYITTKDGYSFDGWYTEKELTNKVDEIKITANTTVYAKWIEGENGNVINPNYKPDIFTDEHYAYIVGREGGYFYPNDDLTRAEAAEMLYRLLDSEVRTEAQTKVNTFADVNENDWFNTSVSTLANLAVINGRTAEEFAPNEKITRAEFTTMMVRISDIEYDGEDFFSDIAEHWAKAYINIAAYINWVQGDDGLFRPDDSITRAEVVTIINRVLGRQPESKDDLLGGMVTPPDNTDEDAWYYLAVQEAVNSHNYELNDDGVHEKWTSLTENPDWTNIND